MYSEQQLKELTELSKKGGQQLKNEMKRFDLVMDGVMQNVTPEDKGIVEKIKMLTTKAMNLAQQGKAEEAKAVMEELKNLKK